MSLKFPWCSSKCCLWYKLRLGCRKRLEGQYWHYTRGRVWLLILETGLQESKCDLTRQCQKGEFFVLFLWTVNQLKNFLSTLPTHKIMPCQSQRPTSHNSYHHHQSCRRMSGLSHRLYVKYSARNMPLQHIELTNAIPKAKFIAVLFSA